MPDSNVVPMNANTTPALDSLDEIQNACIIFSRLRATRNPTTQTVKDMIAAAQRIIDVAGGPMQDAQDMRTQMLRDLGVLEEAPSKAA